jgi:uncharacterized protein (UPF0179 family)
MTKILAIEGTDIRIEIVECDDCPMFNKDTSEGLWDNCNLRVDDAGTMAAPPATCPLPEKVMP